MTADTSAEWTPGSKARATRRRFLLGGIGTVAAAGALSIVGGNPISALSGAADGTSGIVPYRKRSDWGANEQYRFDSNGKELFPPDFNQIQKVTVHHTGTWVPASADEAAMLVQNIYYDHAVIEGMGDIGYHLLIAPDGTVYEGRWSGGTHFPVYDVRPGATNRPPMAVTGAHVQGYNVGNIGIAIMGDLDSADMSDEAWNSLQIVVAMIMAHTGIDPSGRNTYRNHQTGLSVTVPNIAMHRNYIWTECPGDILSGYWSQLAGKVAARMDDMSSNAWLA